MAATLCEACFFLWRSLRLELAAFTGRDGFRRVNGVCVLLHLDDFPVHVNEVGHAACSGNLSFKFVVFLVDALLSGDRSSKVAEQWKGHSVLVGKGFVDIGVIHAHTQNLGVCRFQLG